MNVSNLESTRNCTFYYIEYFDANSCMNRTQSSSVIFDCFLKMCLRVGYFFISNQEYLDNFTCRIKKNCKSKFTEIPKWSCSMTNVNSKIDHTRGSDIQTSIHNRLML